MFSRYCVKIFRKLHLHSQEYSGISVSGFTINQDQKPNTAIFIQREKADLDIWEKKMY